MWFPNSVNHQVRCYLRIRSRLYECTCLYSKWINQVNIGESWTQCIKPHSSLLRRLMAIGQDSRFSSLFVSFSNYRSIFLSYYCRYLCPLILTCLIYRMLLNKGLFRPHFLQCLNRLLGCGIVTKCIYLMGIKIETVLIDSFMSEKRGISRTYLESQIHDIVRNMKITLRQR